MNKITNKEIQQIAIDTNIEYATLKAFLEVESGGKGFDYETGKIIIQFEPAWFRKKAPYTPSGLWSLNKIERQKAEWLAFNDAFSKHPKAAMESTSIGLGQIMGFHWKRLGYKNVDELWDDAKKGEYNQVLQIVKFIKTDAVLHNAILSKNWHQVALSYNGKGYLKLARRIGREPYNISLRKAYDKYK